MELAGEIDHRRLSELIGGADANAVAVAAVAALDRSLPVLAAAVGVTLDRRELFGPVREALSSGQDWRAPLAVAKARILDAVGQPLDEETVGGETFELADLVYQMVLHIPAEFTDSEIREWAEGCANHALDLRQALDALADESSEIIFVRAGDLPELTPLEASELRRQITILTALGAREPDVTEAFRISDSGIAETRTALDSVLPVTVSRSATRDGRNSHS